MNNSGAGSRREFTRQILAAGSAYLTAPAVIRTIAADSPALAISDRPVVTHGVSSGDVSAGAGGVNSRVIIWSRANRQSRMELEWVVGNQWSDARKRTGPVVDSGSDFTGKMEISNLPPGQRIRYRVRFEDRASKGSVSEWSEGEFSTPSLGTSDLHFAWSGDTAGQGWGIDVSRGGMRTYAAIREKQPDFFVHSGDTIYADNPLFPEVKLADGTVWKNLMTPAKEKVAETLEEFRGNHRYNLEDANLRAFLATTPLFSQWDDHEIRNNWYPGQKIAGDARYTEKDINTLVGRSRRAFFDYQPLAGGPGARIYRHIPRGPLCDLFFLDLRTYRSPNNYNRQPTQSRDTDYLGIEQLRWLKEALVRSRATWKIICSDMPLAMMIIDANGAEALANGDGPPLGRELEIADLLSHMKRNRVKNVIWLTADVHHAVAHHFDPTRAVFTDFDPFWEFVTGPLHAGTFGPLTLDPTFGPEVRWNSRKLGDPAYGPWSEHQFFGTVRINGTTQAATVSQFNRDGRQIYSVEIPMTT